MPSKRTEAIDKSTRLKTAAIYDRVPTTQGDIKPGGAGSQFRMGVKKDLEGTKGKLLGVAAGEAVTAGIGGLALRGVRAGLGAVRAARTASEVRPSTAQTVNETAAEYLDKIYKRERGAGRSSTTAAAPRTALPPSSSTGRAATTDAAEIAKLRAAERARPANVAEATKRAQAIERAKAQAAVKGSFRGK